MSISVIKRILEVYDGPPNQKLTLVAIASFCNEKGALGVAWPGVARIASMVGVSERQVQRIIRQLEHDGDVTIERRAGWRYTNIFTINQRYLEREDTQSGHDDEVTPMSPHKDDEVTSSAHEVTPMSPEQVLEQVLERPSLENLFLFQQHLARAETVLGKMPGGKRDYVTEKILSQLADWHQMAWWDEALSVCVEAEKTGWSYFIGILSNCIKERHSPRGDKPVVAVERRSTLIDPFTGEKSQMISNEEVAPWDIKAGDVLREVAT